MHSLPTASFVFKNQTLNCGHGNAFAKNGREQNNMNYAWNNCEHVGVPMVRWHLSEVCMELDVLGMERSGFGLSGRGVRRAGDNCDC